MVEQWAGGSGVSIVHHGRCSDNAGSLAARETGSPAAAERDRPKSIESPDANVRLETFERVAGTLGLEVDLNLVPKQAIVGETA
jgi:hypothetical protein